jgi:spore maturation protein CgeB
MRFVLFYHSLLSDWNHGNAHFLRGVVTELLNLGHRVEVYEPADGWSLRRLRQEEGDQALDRFHEAYPQLHSRLYSVDDRPHRPMPPTFQFPLVVSRHPPSGSECA